MFSLTYFTPLYTQSSFTTLNFFKFLISGHTWSSQLASWLPLGLSLIAVHSVTLLIIGTRSNHLSLHAMIYQIIFYPSTISSISHFLSIPHQVFILNLNLSSLLTVKTVKVTTESFTILFPCWYFPLSFLILSVYC